MTRSTLAIGAIACVMLAACGHYGPPVHPVARESEPTVGRESERIPPRAEDEPSAPSAPNATQPAEPESP